MMGAGFIGSMHSDIYARLPNADLTAVLIRDVKKAEAVRDRTGSKVFCDIDSFFDFGGFDILDICLPTYLHEQAILRSLSEGKHVLCEKPLTLGVASADRIRSALAQTDRKLMVAHVLRFWPQYRKIQQLVQTGTIGAV